MPSAARTLEVRPAARLFKALGDETRLRIVALLSHGELCVCHLEEALELPQPTVSRHLATLRASAVVESRRDGSWVHYSLAPQLDKLCRQQLDLLAESFGARATLRQDVKQLLKTKGSTSCK